MKINKLLNEDKQWMEIKTPDGLEERTMRYIAKRIAAEAVWKRVLRYTLAGMLSVMIAVGTFLFLDSRNTNKVILIYAYNGESKVEVIGNFNNWEEKISMTHDKKNGVWVGEIPVKGNGVFEYQFVIDDVIYTAGTAEYKIVDEDGNEHGIIML
ncbi:MAG: hypothetical protein A2Y33_14710 [Spirochaetes bacterium GWF1_51_8]|nr:MAG: hypothetical protein A2Y33_14710 [Spirochaetes bacterium GWF1_51_8]